VRLVGHSRGGYVAFRVARRFPDRVAPWSSPSRAGTSTRPCGRRPGAGRDAAAPPISFGAAAERIRAGDTDGGLAVFVDALGGPAPGRAVRAGAAAMRDNAGTLLGQLRERRPPFTRADAEAIAAPTLLVGAERSPPAYARILDALERSLRDVRRATVPGAAHPMNRSNPDAFNVAVLDFLASRAA
jgi:pimeloyl-ACP methyl ester carboxylesterase